MELQELVKEVERLKAGLEEKVAHLEAMARQYIDSLERTRAGLSAEVGQQIDDLLAIHNMTMCVRCQGTGAVQRLDAGYMRRFVMREWNGCPACGGDGNAQKARGFVEKQSPHALTSLPQKVTT